MEDIKYHDFLNMCRTCMLDIDVKPIEDLIIIETLEFITEKQFRVNDELPQQICGACIKKLLEISTFLKQARSSEDTLKRYLSQFKNECPGATVDPGIAPLEVYVLEPQQIKTEAKEPSPAEPGAQINFENIIKDMRKEFDVLPTDPLTTPAIKQEPDDVSSDEIPEENVCDNCGKTFTARNSLKRHMRLHSSDNPIKCKTCLKVFSEVGHLVKHERIHLGIRPHGCDICNKHFTELVQLKRHERTHSSVKPFRCDVCKKVFASTCGLERHRRIHTIHKCKTCAKTFKSDVHLRKHSKIHVV